MSSTLEIHVLKLWSFFPFFSLGSSLFDHITIIHRSCSFWFWNSSISLSHIFKHIMVNNFCFLSCWPKENVSITCFLQIPMWNILYKSSIRLYLLYFITIIDIKCPYVETIGIFEEVKRTSSFKKCWFFLHSSKFILIG